MASHRVLIRSPAHPPPLHDQIISYTTICYLFCLFRDKERAPSSVDLASAVRFASFYMGVGRVTGLLVRERAELGYGLLSLDIRLVIPYGWMTGRNTVTGLFDWEDRQASMARKPVCSSPADGGSSIWLVCFAFFFVAGGGGDFCRIYGGAAREGEGKRRSGLFLCTKVSCV